MQTFFFIRERGYQKAAQAKKLVDRNLPKLYVIDLPLIRVWLPLAIFAALVCARMPEVAIKGRFWAEEGRVFFHNAWTLPPIEALFAPYAGYLNIAASGATLASRWLVPLTFAPYLTTTVALVVQLCPPLLLLASDEDWIPSFRSRIAGASLLLLISGSEEVWLQTLTCQFQLTLCAGIILVLGPPRKWVSILRIGILFFAPLCGPTGIVLLPLFVVRTVIDRTGWRLIETCALAIGSVLQISFFFKALAGRGYTLDPVALLCAVTVRHVDLPFFGVSHASLTASAIRDRLAAGHIPLKATILPIVLLSSLVAAIFQKGRSYSPAWLLAGACLLAGASYFGAIGGVSGLIDARSGGRYVYVPQALLSLSILALATTSNPWTSRICWIVVSWLLIVGAREYRHPWSYVSDGPAWRPEVAEWRIDPTHALMTWPEGWSVKLGPVH